MHSRKRFNEIRGRGNRASPTTAPVAQTYSKVARSLRVLALVGAILLASVTLGVIEDARIRESFCTGDQVSHHAATLGIYQYTIGETNVSGSDNIHFDGPVGIAVNVTGDVYVAEPVNTRVQVFDKAGTYQYTIGVTGVTGSDNAHFSYPRGVAVNATGHVYVTDMFNQRVQVFDKAGTYQYTIGGLINPSGIAVNSTGHLYVTELHSDRVQVFDKAGTYQYTIGFLNPSGIAVNSTGHVYIAGNEINRVLVFNNAGTYQYTIGNGRYGCNNDQFSSPSGVAVNTTGHVYVADSGNNRVQVFDNAGTYQYTIGSGFGSDNAQFEWPNGIAVNSTGHVYVVDGGNDRVQVFSPGIITPAGPEDFLGTLVWILVILLTIAGLTTIFLWRQARRATRLGHEHLSSERKVFEMEGNTKTGAPSGEESREDVRSPGKEGPDTSKPPRVHPAARVGLALGLVSAGIFAARAVLLIFSDVVYDRTLFILFQVIPFYALIPGLAGNITASTVLPRRAAAVVTLVLILEFSFYFPLSYNQDDYLALMLGKPIIWAFPQICVGFVLWRKGWLPKVMAVVACFYGSFLFLYTDPISVLLSHSWVKYVFYFLWCILWVDLNARPARYLVKHVQATQPPSTRFLRRQGYVLIVAAIGWVLAWWFIPSDPWMLILSGHSIWDYMVIFSTSWWNVPVVLIVVAAIHLVRARQLDKGARK